MIQADLEEKIKVFYAYAFMNRTEIQPLTLNDFFEDCLHICSSGKGR